MQIRLFTEPMRGASYADQERAARHAEECGFDGYFRADHYRSLNGVDGLPGSTDAWTTLAGLALATSRIRLGTLVTSATFRLPGPLAVTVAQVDEMSGGRIDFGIGAGWYLAEHTAYGIPFPSAAERFDRLAEQLAIITGLWRAPAGEPFTYRGLHYAVTDSPALPKPAQRPGPPIIIGGWGPKRTPELAAQYADEFNAPFRYPHVVARQFARVAEACSRLGRTTPLSYSAGLSVCCGRTDADIRRRAERFADRIGVKVNSHAGTPDQVAEWIGELRAVGAQRVYLRIVDLTDLDHLDLIAAEVLPQVRT